MTRSRFRRSLVAVAAAGLIASSLSVLPTAVAEESAPGAPATTTDGGTPEATPEPTISPTESSSPTASEPPDPSMAADEGAVDDYIVVVRNGAYIDSVKDKAEQLGGQSNKELRGAVDGFTATLTEQDVEVLEEDPNVKYIEPDELVEVNGAVSGFVDCDAYSIGARDDGGVGPIDLGFNVDWFGTSYSSIYINNNGGFVFNDGGGSFTAFSGVDLQTAPRPYVLPLFTDIDTTLSSGVVEFGPLDNANPSAGYCINWIDVGEYGSSDRDYSFQVILTNLGGGEIDLEFNYDRVSVPTNSFNRTFEVGYTAGDQTNYQVMADSTEPTSTVASRLVSQKFPTSCTVPGRYIYEIRSSGTPTPGPTPTPQPTTPDPTPSATQSPATWGLDRIDQTSSTLNNAYITPTVSTASDNYGQGVVVYVVDTGVRYTHQEFGDRARKNEAVKGIDTVSNDSDPNDCNGHGTHVAGTVGGATYGVAKLVQIVGVRVLGCTGAGWTSDVIAGLNAIPSFHASHYGSGYRAVVNMSLGGDASLAMNAAVASLTSANIPVVVAAGNDNEDAGSYSPASEPTAITVGSSSSADTRSYFSNYGPVVDVFAPGSDITAAWYTSNTAIYTMSGTSMASPHVAGSVALYLGINSVNGNSPTTAEVEQAIVGYAQNNALTLNSPPTTTVNKLLNVTGYIAPFTPYTSFSARSASLTDDEPEPSQIARVARQLIESRCTSRDSGGNPAPPAAPPTSGGDGSSGGGGGSSAGEKPGEGGGGLNAVTAIVPSASGAPGRTIALAGWGLETTRDVMFNDVSARFSVISGRQVEVTVPDVPPGVYVIHAVLAPDVGRASYWDGFTVQSRATSVPGSAVPVGNAPKATEDGRANFLTFKGTTTRLTQATKSKLERLAGQFAGTAVQGTIVAYTNAKGTAASTRRAQSRAENIRDFLEGTGLKASMQIVTEPGSTTLQSRGALVYLKPADSSAAATDGDTVRSLIVRLKKGRSITIGGKVRGVDNVTGGLGESLTVGPYLGLRMYRIDFAQPVSIAVAERVARQLSRDPGIEFAEPDSLVSAQVSITR